MDSIWTWEKSRPIREDWQPNMCFYVGTVWAKGTTGGMRRDRDYKSSNTICGGSSEGPGSTEFCSRNNYDGLGSAVREMQRALIRAGYTGVGIVDGVIGTNTDAAIRAFQTAHGLTSDGLVGQNTWNTLRYY